MNKVRITESQLRGLVKRMIKEEMQTTQQTQIEIQKFEALLKQSFGNSKNESVIVILVNNKPETIKIEKVQKVIKVDSNYEIVFNTDSDSRYGAIIVLFNETGESFEVRGIIRKELIGFTSSNTTNALKALFDSSQRTK